MTPGSLPPLSPHARALLSAERDILPRSELERRRAALRARTALWHARESVEFPRARSLLVAWWKRASLAAVALLGATSAFAAWVALEPAGSLDGGATVVESAAAPPVVLGVPPRTTSLDDGGRRSPSAPGVHESNSSPPEAGTSVETSDRGQTPPAVQNESEPAAVAAHGTPFSFSKRSRPRSSSTNAQGTSSEELALLDRARRAARAGDFRAALLVIERHARSFPKSQLAEEREALRVRALAGAGLSAKAGEAARDFESRYPKSVLAPELQKNDRTTP